ncbi:hypothetical protein EZS27_023913 [termite gut metagenome]|uniref:Uncharacterized protein n=1 Tax=termite gut metagenome TaxID=433724 RepID=A0A5J4R1F5_9ZZZZ
MALTKVLITVKTYPTISSKYEELVCTAGFLEDGTWIRIYPIQFRKKPYSEQYKKYDRIELDLVKNDRDFRPESYRPYSIDSDIKILGHINTKNNWAERKSLVLQKVYFNLSELIAEAHNKEICTSLAVFKPRRILDFKIESVEREWDKKKLDSLRQMNLFETVSTSGKIEVVRKLPYKFSYLFEDEAGTESCLMIEDWEIGRLYWNCLAKYEGNESKAVADVRQKYFDDFAQTKDLHLFLGTSQVHHFPSRNPFMIIGTFQPKKELQGSLF